MPTTPQPITLRPITAADVTANPDLDVYLRHSHGGQVYYSPGKVSAVQARDVHSNGLFGYQMAQRAGLDPERHPVIGQHIEVTATDTFRQEVTVWVDTSQEVFDALYPESDKLATRSTMLNRAARRDICVPGDGGPQDFEAQTLPIFGAEVNLRVFVKDGDPEQIVAELTALLESKGRVVRAQARPLPDLRVNVFQDVLDEDFNAQQRLVGVNVLTAEVFEFMRNKGQGTISTRDVPYGASAPAIGD